MKKEIGIMMGCIGVLLYMHMPVQWAAADDTWAPETSSAVEVSNPGAHPVEGMSTHSAAVESATPHSHTSEGAAVESKPVVVDLSDPALRLTEGGTSDKPVEVEVVIPEKLPVAGRVGVSSEEPVKYTLGPEDVITIDVRRHPEFSGTYGINSEGKIQYKYVGDIHISGLTKTEAKKKLNEVLSAYIVDPTVEITITEYRSKVFYVIGEVGRPGKFYMMADEIPVREAVVQAGLPLLSGALKKAKLITPDSSGRPVTKRINLDTILYKGNLKENLLMRPGDVLYIPPTFLTKVMRVISPVAQPVGTVAATEGSAARVAAGGL